MELSSVGPQPNVPAPPPPPGWPTMPPPKKAGLPAWAIVVIVIVVVAVVLVAIVVAAVLFFLAAPIDGTTKPMVTFGQPEAVTNGFEFWVAGASRALPAATYRVALSQNGTAIGTARTLAASMTFGPFTITWTDLGGEGDLTGGDLFRVTQAGGLPANTDFVVSVLWTDGSTVGSRDYSS